MSKVTIFVGLDYHKESVQICAMDRDGKVLINRSRPNDATAVAVLVASTPRSLVVGSSRDTNLLRSITPTRATWRASTQSIRGRLTRMPAGIGPGWSRGRSAAAGTEAVSPGNG